MSGLLEGLGRRVRHLRSERGWTRAQLAERSGLSVRFLAQIESGRGNISLLRLEALARALETGPEQLVRAADPGRGMVALVGLRGAGKSTVGSLLARRLDLPFVELDQRIVEAAGLPLHQLFELHGEEYYRRLEREALRHCLGSGESMVLAAAGGIVTEPTSWEMLRRNASVVWLRASPEEHWNRVVAQGDRRPMADHPSAMDALRSLLRSRAEVYAQAAVTVETTGLAPAEVCRQVELALAQLGAAR
jgi:XRE family aerobic/anaerobic benzoate catabolism transcriptional regulator